MPKQRKIATFARFPAELAFASHTKQDASGACENEANSMRYSS